MATVRQIPGGPAYAASGTTREAQIPGAQYVNEVAAAAGGRIMSSLVAAGGLAGHGGIAGLGGGLAG